MDDNVETTLEIDYEFDSYDGSRCVFRKRRDVSGILVSQILDINRKNDKLKFCIRRPDGNQFSGRRLYHVTKERFLKKILKEGLRKDVGDMYAGHWCGFHGNFEIRKFLEPGVFFTTEKPVNGFPVVDGYPVLEVCSDSLDQSRLLEDCEIAGSVFYAGDVPPELLRVIMGEPKEKEEV